MGLGLAPLRGVFGNWGGGEPPPPPPVEPVASRYTDWGYSTITDILSSPFQNHSLLESFHCKLEQKLAYNAWGQCILCLFLLSVHLVPHTSNVTRIGVHNAQEVY